MSYDMGKYQRDTYAVGDHVRLLSISPVPIIGEVVELLPTKIRVRWITRINATEELFPSEIRRVCKNCHMEQSRHTKGGKCLFGSTNWA